MAVTTQESTQYAQIYTTQPQTNVSPAEWEGKLRVAVFDHTQSGAGDATSSVALCKLPAGRVRLMLPLSWMYVNWTTASATLDLGWDAYTNTSDTAVAADPNGLLDGISVENAGVIGFEELTTLAGLDTAGHMKVFESKEGVVLRATSQDVALADASYITGALIYVRD